MEAATYPSIVLLQDPPVSQPHLPSFNGFKLFFPPVRAPLVAAYVHSVFFSHFSVLHKFKGVDDIHALDLSSQEPFFGTKIHSFTLINAYSTNTCDSRVHSVSPKILFLDLGVPLLVVGDLYIHKPLPEPLRPFSWQGIVSSTPYFEKAVEAGFTLRHPPEEYTRFLEVGSAHPSLIDLACANPLLLPMVQSSEASLPSTASNHMPITIKLPPTTVTPSPKRPDWSNTDWETLSPIMNNVQAPLPPSCPSQSELDEWLSGSLDRLTALVKEPTPGSRPSHHCKPWWSPHLTTLHREFHKASRTARKHNMPTLRDLTSVSKAGYFKAIKVAKNHDWSSFQLIPTPQSLWRAKLFAYGCAPSRCPSRLGGGMNEVLLDHYLPPQEAFAPPPWLRPYKKAATLTKDEIAAALSK